VAKSAVIFVIALVLVAAVLLRPAPSDVERPVLVPARTLAVHTVALPGAPLRTTVQSRLRTRSELFPNGFRVDSEPVRSRFRVGSEYEYGATQVGGTNAFTELRTSKTAGEPLAGRALAPTADDAPIVSSAPPDARPSRHLTRALDTAAQQTSSAFRTAGRAIRSVF
jgi:hypothetical protein